MADRFEEISAIVENLNLDRVGMELVNTQSIKSAGQLSRCLGEEEGEQG